MMSMWPFVTMMVVVVVVVMMLNRDSFSADVTRIIRFEVYTNFFKKIRNFLDGLSSSIGSSLRVTSEQKRKVVVSLTITREGQV